MYMYIFAIDSLTSYPGVIYLPFRASGPSGFEKRDRHRGSSRDTWGALSDDAYRNGVAVVLSGCIILPVLTGVIQSFEGKFNK